MSKCNKSVKRKYFTSLEIEKWAASRNISIFVAMMAQRIAASADDLYMACRDSRVNETYGRELPYPEPEHWLLFYDHDEKPLITASELICPNEAFDNLIWGNAERVEKAADSVWNFLEENYSEQFTPESFKVFWARGQILAREMYRSHLDQMRMDFDGVDDATPEQISTVQNSPEVLFLLRVWLPCWVEYGQPLDELLSTARTGDIDAIEKLLRLDNGTVTCDPLINRHYIEAQRAGKTYWVQRYTNAMQVDAEPVGNFTSQHIKYWLAALIYEFSHYLDERWKLLLRQLELRYKRGCKPKFKLSYDDILALFDALAKDTSGRNDPDFRDIYPKSFETRVREQRKFWQTSLIAIIREADKELAKANLIEAAQKPLQR